SCRDIMERGQTRSGIYTVFVKYQLIQVYCDMDTDGGGWLVFQRRRDGVQDFRLGWTDYADGFGKLSRDFWLGNRNLNLLTSGQRVSLRVDMGDKDGQVRYALYQDFNVESELEKFKLSVHGYSGNAGDSLSYHDRHLFSTIDKDNDKGENEDCASRYKGGWWYAQCHHSNPNGLYLNGTHTSNADGINWYHWRGHRYSLSFFEMKIRPSN
ncbi:hypothetical protein CAPTEDRAFT_98948, partial [Capitella teleta]